MHLRIIGQKQGVPGLAMIFQEGVRVQAPAGSSLHDFLIKDMGLDNDYVRERIATVFLDGRPMDNLEKAHLTAGSTIALSGALPGLAGAILRRGTPLASLRSRSLEEELPPVPDSLSTIFVKVRLFNVLIEELGPIFMSRGIVVETGRLRSFMERSGLLCDTRFLLNNEPVSGKDLFGRLEGGNDGQIIVSVTGRAA